jgi:ketosteroid isomerase-like protein
MNVQHTELERIDRARAIHVAALNDGDASAWAACFDTDAVQMPPQPAAQRWHRTHPAVDARVPRRVPRGVLDRPTRR